MKGVELFSGAPMQHRKSVLVEGEDGWPNIGLGKE